MQDALQFLCQDCPSPGLQPFLANLTAGFEMWVSQAIVNSSGDNASL